MTPHERDLLSNLFQRVGQAPLQDRDPEAEALIREALAHYPQAPYVMAQGLLMQEMALKEAQAKISDLEAQLLAAQSVQAAQSRSAPPSGGSFLGAGGPWGSSRIPSTPLASPPPAYATQPAYAPPPVQPGFPQPQQSGIGGFLRNAATMAAGVAGGEMLFRGLEGLFGGRGGGGYGGGFGGGLGGGFDRPTEVIEETVVNNFYGNDAIGNDSSSDDFLSGGDDFGGSSDDGLDF